MGRELKPLLTEGAKKRTFKRRMLGLKKKISELSILCNVDTCFICLQGNSSLQKTTIWPENSSELVRIISRYAKLGKKREQAAEKGSKKKRNREEKQLSCSYPTCDHGLNGFSKAFLIDLVRALDSKIDSIKNRIALCEKQNEITPSQQAGLPTIPLVSDQNQPKPLTTISCQCFPTLIWVSNLTSMWALLTLPPV